MPIVHATGVRVPRDEAFLFSAEYSDKHMAAEPAASRRLDAYLRLNAEFGMSRLKPRSPYNPVKNKNDSMDLDLLVFLAIPVAVCTVDGRFQRTVEATGSWQAPWVLTPPQLAQAVGDGTLSLDWPAE